MYLLKKVVATEKDININERDANGWTALHLASYFGLLHMIWFLIEDQRADYTITTNKGETPIYLCANNRDVCMTQYYLELGEEMPKILPKSRDNTDIAKFFKLLCREFRGEDAQLTKLYNEQKNYVVYTSGNYDDKNINIEIYDKKIIGNIEDIIDLI